MSWIARVFKGSSYNRSSQDLVTPAVGVQPPARPANVITARSALTLSTVYRAVTLLSTGASQMTLDTWRGDKPISSPLWVRQPDAKLSRSAFLAETTNSLALYGNAFWQVIRDDQASPVTALIPLEHDLVSPQEDGTFGYQGKTFQPWQVQHLKLMRLPGVLMGFGPIQAARAELTGQLDLRDYASEWFDTSGIPSGVLSVDSEVTDEDARAMRDYWNETQSQRNGVAVLSHGAKFAPVLLKPADAQFLESQQFGTSQIARLFGIPSHMILAAVEGTSNTYTNLADADLNFVRWTLMTYLREIEEAFTQLLPRGQTARFNLDAVLRPSTKARYEAHKLGLEAGFLTVDEVRAIEGLEPLPAKENTNDSNP